MLGMNNERNTGQFCRRARIKESRDLVRVNNIRATTCKQFSKPKYHPQAQPGALVEAGHFSSRSLDVWGQQPGALQAEDTGPLTQTRRQPDLIDHISLKSPEVQRKDNVQHFEFCRAPGFMLIPCRPAFVQGLTPPEKNRFCSWNGALIFRHNWTSPAEPNGAVGAELRLRQPRS